MVEMLKNLYVFFCDIKQEIRRIAWVKKQQVLSSLFIVIIVILCFSIFFCFVDFMSLYVIKTLFGIIYGI
ncbi:preprotein translocase subunit SecE [Wolbachia endosymbiont of Drosophila simulans wNo]|uniref:preprotein translocase subunit SecE n=2 Tax=unclassified Wolbachia TaxID=2640676 RepID=UPI0002D24A9B|nr:preprotein translocase subunit SecE [Wolbachia endosymbiont of Drosophila simulans wNo]QCB62891.1 preprotein translocase subunit SecE [Wolbachia endosymbiont of Drosophila mauritiana]QCB63936.1 preprotein translocase subunit SecE [Wolbachia endosymbiont of Drosophila mauritiana]QWE33801.1 Preprotein translocase, SecE subunit [Wolbachia endosymbiont of Drosophila simulans]TGB07945.1 preprotein translocase subunit SecE [Wolbachia endosymbiont of Drosophila mauritiana]